jgi:hypothetical protein
LAFFGARIVLGLPSAYGQGGFERLETNSEQMEAISMCQLFSAVFLLVGLLFPAAPVFEAASVNTLDPIGS